MISIWHIMNGWRPTPTSQGSRESFPKIFDELQTHSGAYFITFHGMDFQTMAKSMSLPNFSQQTGYQIFMRHSCWRLSRIELDCWRRQLNIWLPESLLQISSARPIITQFQWVSPCGLSRRAFHWMEWGDVELGRAGLEAMILLPNVGPSRWLVLSPSWQRWI